MSSHTLLYTVATWRVCRRIKGSKCNQNGGSILCWWHFTQPRPFVPMQLTSRWCQCIICLIWCTVFQFTLLFCHLTFCCTPLPPGAFATGSKGPRITRRRVDPVRVAFDRIRTFCFQAAYFEVVSSGCSLMSYTLYTFIFHFVWLLLTTLVSFH